MTDYWKHDKIRELETEVRQKDIEIKKLKDQKHRLVALFDRVPSTNHCFFMEDLNKILGE